MSLKKAKKVSLKEIQALVSSCFKIDPTKRYLLMVDCRRLSQALCAELPNAWKILTGTRAITLATVGGEGVRIWEIEDKNCKLWAITGTLIGEQLYIFEELPEVVQQTQGQRLDEQGMSHFRD